MSPPQAIQIDKSQIERMVGKFDGKPTAIVMEKPSEDSSAGPSTSSPSPSVGGIPQPPPLPYWFDRECRNTLMMVGPQPHRPTIPSSTTTYFNPPIPPKLLTQEDIKQQLKNQLEYYFSRENLLTDRYLKCQMDSEHYVPINVVAAFPKVSRLTQSIEMIVEAVKDSLNLELDENEEKVRAVSKRTTIIIREIPEEFREEVVKLLADGPQFTELIYGLNDSWYVTYKDELDTQCAYVNVQNRKNEVTQRPVCARIKAGGIPAAVAPPPEGVSPEPVRLAATNGDKGPTIQVMDPGQTLALGEVGLVPIASYRPGEQMSHYTTPTCSFSVNSYGYAQPMAPQQPQPLMQQTQNYYYPSSVSTTPRNFDEMSTASSNSTRTSSSNYNRNGGNRNDRGNYSNPYYESRSSSFSHSTEWRPRGGGRGGYQGNHHNNQTRDYQTNRDHHQNRDQNNHQNNSQQNHNEYNGRSNNTRGNWRNGMRNGVTSNGERTNGPTNQYHRQNGQSNWRNEQQTNGHSWQNESSQNNYQRPNSSYNNGYHSTHNQTYNNRYKSHPSSSSSSDVSSKHLSSEEGETPTNSVPGTPPQKPNGQEYSAPTPTDLPTPPVWPAPSFDRRRKSSEASTITTTNTLTPSTPVTPSEPVFVQEPPLPLLNDLSITEKTEKKEVNGVNHHKVEHKPDLKVEQKTTVPAVEKEKVRSPPATAQVKSPLTPPAPTPSFAFEETAFPSLPKKVEPVKAPQKPTFSSVAAGRLKQIKQMPPQKKTSYAEKLKQRESLLQRK